MFLQMVNPKLSVIVASSISHILPWTEKVMETSKLSELFFRIKGSVPFREMFSEKRKYAVHEFP